MSFKHARYFGAGMFAWGEFLATWSYATPTATLSRGSFVLITFCALLWIGDRVLPASVLDSPES